MDFAHKMPQSELTLYFEPLPDITVYELAQIVGYLGGYTSPRNGINAYKHTWQAMSDDLKRHFRVEPRV